LTFINRFGTYFATIQDAGNVQNGNISDRKSERIKKSTRICNFSAIFQEQEKPSLDTILNSFAIFNMIELHNTKKPNPTKSDFRTT
jgi:hypothetical protein